LGSVVAKNFGSKKLSVRHEVSPHGKLSVNSVEKIMFYRGGLHSSNFLGGPNRG